MSEIIIANIFLVSDKARMFRRWF